MIKVQLKLLQNNQEKSQTTKITIVTASSSVWLLLTRIDGTVVGQITLIHIPVIVKDQLQIGQFVHLHSRQVTVVPIGVIAQLSAIISWFQSFRFPRLGLFNLINSNVCQMGKFRMKG